MNTLDSFGAHHLKLNAKEMIKTLDNETLTNIINRLTTDQVDFATFIEHQPLVAAHMIRMVLWEDAQAAQKTGS